MFYNSEVGDNRATASRATYIPFPINNKNGSQATEIGHPRFNFDRFILVFLIITNLFQLTGYHFTIFFCYT